MLVVFMLQNISVPKNVPYKINFLGGHNHWTLPLKSSVLSTLAIVIKS